MKNHKTLLLIIIAVLILLIGSGTALYFYFKHNPQNDVEAVNKTNILETIEGYDYTLEDRDTELYKQYFNELKTVLMSNEVDFEKYSELLSKLYIIDLYTINNKINKYDVGALEFVHPNAKDNYVLKVQDTIYKYVEDNSYNNRKQELPVVTSTETSNIKEEQITIENEAHPGYSVDITWTYEKDLGYDKKATLKLIKSDKFLYIVKQNVSD